MALVARAAMSERRCGLGAPIGPTAARGPPGATPVEQREEQIVLERRKTHRLPFAQHESRGALDGDLPEPFGETLRAVVSAGAAQQRLDAREELEHAERLGDVVVGAVAEAH